MSLEANSTTKITAPGGPLNRVCQRELGELPVLPAAGAGRVLGLVERGVAEDLPAVEVGAVAPRLRREHVVGALLRAERLVEVAGLLVLDAEALARVRRGLLPRLEARLQDQVVSEFIR